MKVGCDYTQTVIAIPCANAVIVYRYNISSCSKCVIIIVKYGLSREEVYIRTVQRIIKILAHNIEGKDSNIMKFGNTFELSKCVTSFQIWISRQ